MSTLAAYAGPSSLRHQPTTRRRAGGGRGSRTPTGWSHSTTRTRTTTSTAFLPSAWQPIIIKSRDVPEEEQFYRARDKHWPGRVLFSRDSAFNGNVRVVQWGDNWRSLDFNGISQGIVYVRGGGDGDDGTVDAVPEVMGSQYLRVMVSAAVGYAALNGRDPSAAGARFIFAGLGAGQLPHFLHHHFPLAHVQVAEICPVVVEANAVLRGGGGGCGPHPNLDVVVADAAAFMSDTNNQQQHTSTCVGDALAVFLDAYDGEGRVPSHLRSPAFLRSCASRLSPGSGTVVANLYNGAPGTEARVEVERFAAAMRREIGPVVSLGVDSKGGDNVVLVAGRATTTINDDGSNNFPGYG